MGFWDFIVWCVLGFFVGAIARFLVPGPDPMGCIGTTLIGVVGGIVGGVVGDAIFGSLNTKFDLPGLLGAVIGGVIVLLIYRLFRRPRVEEEE